jgi:hypothetical protein
MPYTGGEVIRQTGGKHGRLVWSRVEGGGWIDRAKSSLFLFFVSQGDPAAPQAVTLIHYNHRRTL